MRSSFNYSYSRIQIMVINQVVRRVKNGAANEVGDNDGSVEYDKDENSSVRQAILSGV